VNTDDVVKKILTMAAEYLDTLAEDPPEEIFHYTSVDGLYGLLSSRRMWASNLHFLNDVSELKFALDSALDLVRSRAAETTGYEKTFLNALAEQIRGVNWPEIYVASFSEDGDLPSQWRSYCPPDGGYSIGFSGAPLADIARCNDFRLLRCLYDRDEQDNVVKEWLDQALRACESDEPNGREIDLKVFTVPLVVTLISLAPLLKHDSFSEEREWRLSSIPFVPSSSDRRYQTAAGLLVPFRVVPIEDESLRFPLTRVRIGPRRNPYLAEMALKGFVASQKLEVSIERSSTPYRAR
jgi:hypothetical protein